MERSATKAAIRPLYPAGQAPRRSYDARVLFVSAGIGIAAVIAIYVLTVSGPVEPATFDTMVAFP
jgi:uncharacterized membrane protein YbhN (UPF0104 family)